MLLFLRVLAWTFLPFDCIHPSGWSITFISRTLSSIQADDSQISTSSRPLFWPPDFKSASFLFYVAHKPLNMSKPELIIPSSPKPLSPLIYQATTPGINCSHSLLSTCAITQKVTGACWFYLFSSFLWYSLFLMASATALTSPSFHINYWKSLLTCLPRVLLFPLLIHSSHCSKRNLPKVQIQPCHSLLSILQSFHCLGWNLYFHKAYEIRIFWLPPASPASSPVLFPQLPHIVISRHIEFFVVPQRHCILPCFWPFAHTTLCPKSPSLPSAPG